jgi:acetyl esterase
VARRLVDRRRLTLQLLVHPLTDFRFQQPSITEVQAPGLAPDGMKMLRTLYLGAHDFLDPNASPELAGDLTGLPPAVVITVEIDPLRDEGEAYAMRLARAGVETTLIRLPGLVHGFMFESTSIRIIAEAYAQIGGMLQRHFTVIARQPARQDARPV